MKHDKTIEKWLKERNEKELQIIRTLITDERVKNTFLVQALRWTVMECKELSGLRVPISGSDSREIIHTKTEKETDAQMACISRYKESGVCVRCKNPLSGVIKEFNKKDKGDVYLADYLFLSIHQYSGLCINCIEQFLLDYIKKLS